ncbi:MAG: transcription antitermination factor NusB [Gammaproteobacteria bacterium]|nr:transcription antitermination factor NusB [Gammaproteobacteria bacterium]
MKKFRPKERRRARELAMQAIYQWQMTEESPLEIEVQFHQNNNMSKVDVEYFAAILRGVTQNTENIDHLILSSANRTLKDLNPVELALLRVAVYEFLFEKDVPYKVVINEALEMAKKFGAIEGFKYVNGVLDAIAQHVFLGKELPNKE